MVWLFWTECRNTTPSSSGPGTTAWSPPPTWRRPGSKVLVLERRDVVGGCCVTEEVWPGFKVSTAAYVNSLLAARDHPRPGAEEARLRDAAAQPVVVHAVPRRPLPDDGAGPRDDPPRDRQVLREGRRELPEVRGDADAGRRLPRADADADAARPVGAASATCGSSASSGWKFRKLGREVGARGHRDPDRRGPADPRPLVRVGAAEGDDRHRRGHRRLRRAVACRGRRTCCSTTSWASATASAACGATSAAAWGRSRRASPRRRRSYGAEIRTNADVGASSCRDGRATAWRSRTATEFHAKRIASNADANVTFVKLMDPKELPAEFVAAVKRIDYSPRRR